jgi:glycosyltransferase involved in cell wall biosynthesis
VAGLPKISVLIPSFNQAGFLAKTLATVLKQEYEPLEVIVMDGGSTDKTAEVVKAYGPLVTHFQSERDEGQLHAVEKALALATGDICYWLNSDDAVMPGAFKTVAETFRRHPETEIVFSDDHAFVEESRGMYVGATIRYLNFWDHFLFYRQRYSECIFWRREISGQGLPLDHSLRIATDYSFFLPLSHGRKMRWVSQRLGAFRSQPEQMSVKHADKLEREMALIKQRMREKLGMSEEEFGRRQRAHRLSFNLRNTWYARLNSGGRFLWRKITRDRGRKKLAQFFFDEWLQPPAHVKAVLI